MMVTFVSQCEKKSLNKTRRVLDAFANRIGSRTWQTQRNEWQACREFLSQLNQIWGDAYYPMVVE